MAVITQVDVSGSNTPTTTTRTVLGASDTFTYSSGSGQTLNLYNTTASPVTCTLVGSGATTVSPAGLGGTVSVASGIAVTVGASASVVVKLDKVSAYLVGNCSITGGTGVVATLFV